MDQYVDMFLTGKGNMYILFSCCTCLELLVTHFTCPLENMFFTKQKVLTFTMYRSGSSLTAFQNGSKETPLSIFLLSVSAHALLVGMHSL